MGGRGAFSSRGGFTKWEYRSTGEVIAGTKVIEKIGSKSASLPQFSNTPNTMYILKSNGRYTELGVYGPDRRIRKVIDITHRHTNRTKHGIKEVLKKGVAHIHHIRGGRESNVHYLTKKDIKLYGKIILAMGGKIRE